MFLASKFNERACRQIKADFDECTGEDLREAVCESVGYDDIEHLAELLGSMEWLTGCDSSGFAVMVAGSADTWAISRNGWVALFESGDDAAEPGYVHSKFAEADDPGLRATRLQLAESCGGLAGRGMSIDMSGIEDEVRDITFAAGTWHCNYIEALHGDAERVDELVDSHLEQFCSATGLDGDGARESLRLVIASGTFATGAERDVVWSAWKELASGR